MTFHRFFLAPESVRGDTVSFPPAVARQIERVLRLRAGERVIVLDGTGTEYVVALTEGPQRITGVIEQTRRNLAEPTRRLTLYQGLLKGTKMELVLQKGTELGVARFVPVRTARSVPRDQGAGRQERYEVIVREAAEQSRRGRLPEIREVIDFSTAIEHASAAGPVIYLWEEQATLRIRDVLSGSQTSQIGLFVGPEGGFTEDEAALARCHGAEIVTLGPRILRAETAAIVGAALVLDALSELGQA